MRVLFRTSVVLGAALLLPMSLAMYAQGGAGGGFGGGAGRGGGQGRGGFGGGTPVQGTVTAATKDTVTIKTDAGDVYTVTVTDTARIMKDQQTIQLKDIKPGDDVTAMGTVDETKKTVQAMMVRDIDAATVAKAKENMGKTYITGKITAIDADNLKLTIQRTDDVSQVIAVDDGTSFQRGTRGVAADVTAAGGLATGGGFGGGRGGGGFGGGQARGAGAGAGAGGGAAAAAPESITLADIHVGDTVMSTGKLKGGTFTALKMGVSAPVAPGAGRRGAGGDAPAAPAGGAGAPATPAPPQ